MYAYDHIPDTGVGLFLPQETIPRTIMESRMWQSTLDPAVLYGTLDVIPTTIKVNSAGYSIHYFAGF